MLKATGEQQITAGVAKGVWGSDRVACPSKLGHGLDGQVHISVVLGECGANLVDVLEAHA